MGDSVTDSKVTTASPSGNSGLGFRPFMRWVWGQLTSMRTALILLFFLLALAAIQARWCRRALRAR